MNPIPLPTPGGFPSPEGLLTITTDWVVPEIQSVLIFLAGFFVLRGIVRAVSRGV